MRFGKVFFFVLFLCFAVHAQTPKQVKILNNYGEVPFEDGKTIIAEVIFTGLDFMPESEVLKTLKMQRATISAGEEFHGNKVRIAVQIIRELIVSKGYNRAEVIAFGEKLPKNQMKLIFDIKRGELARVSEIRFEGNENVKSEELIEDFKQCLGESWEIYEARKYEFILQKCSLRFIFSKGYLRAKIRAPRLQLVSDSYVVKVEIEEGMRFRFGNLKVQGAKAFTEEKVLEFVGLKTGEIANGKILQDLFYEKLKRIYADKGYILYDAEFEPKFIDPQKAGEDAIVDLNILIDEGRQFKLGKIEFIGVETEKAEVLRKLFYLEDGEIYNQSKIEDGLKKLNELREFYPIDYDSFSVEIWTKQKQEQTEGNIIAEKEGVILRERVDNFEIKNEEDSGKIKLVIKLRKIEQ